ncbi:TPA: hypothetical protein DD449_00775 [Candidatus Berkelbacteria bacterium]|uniref:Activator of Hsp90 ATPase homologue 1/2-like C-terminal domain-containing protein n=1 Tax=Berkelbacteria bacterium GW2011_GWE1_39_12 TaxID=1618337 RepID=A0A0G4B5P8_9BACT|nr:MAG: hypothetical protein UT28_C0001G0931 [Berkelbacteria bacterium GW2011_GWE1_39_12]HBO60205.1 hypothetical protein [Candidatus Berkelbacteria bacterium]
MEKTKITTEPDKLKIVIERVLNAPRELVWKAFNDPELIVQWWGLRDQTTVIEKMEVKPGGEWRFISHNPDGSKDIFYGEYKEIKPPYLVSQTFNYEPIGLGHESLDTVDLSEMDGKTKLKTTSVFKTLDDLNGMIGSGMEKGVNESYERLDDLLEKMKAE